MPVRNETREISEPVSDHARPVGSNGAIIREVPVHSAIMCRGNARFSVARGGTRSETKARVFPGFIARSIVSLRERHTIE